MRQPKKKKRKPFKLLKHSTQHKANTEKTTTEVKTLIHTTQQIQLRKYT